MTSSRRILFVMGCALSLLAIPAFAAEDVIPAGTDIWFTDASSTFVQFAENPIPAGFFCSGSKPFIGVVHLKGMPLATRPERAFGGADTIMQRLDDAEFDADGVAHSRIQFKALSLVSVEPIKTACGPFNVTVTLTGGDQPVSPHMTIVRLGDGGGYFTTEFDASFKISFTPAKDLGGVLPGKRGKPLDLVWSTTMRGTHAWAHRPGAGGVEYGDYVEVDTNGDHRPDTLIPGTTANFAVGWTAEGNAFMIKAVTAESGGSHGVCGDPC